MIDRGLEHVDGALDSLDDSDGQAAAFRLWVAVQALVAARGACLDAPVVVRL